MSTRGNVKVGNNYYYISSDAYPEFTRKHFKLALVEMKTPTPRAFVAAANRAAGFKQGGKWIEGKVDKEWRDSFYNEYDWKVNLKTKEVEGRKARGGY